MTGPTCAQHAAVVKSASDPATYLVSDQGDPLRQSLAALDLPEVLRGGPSAASPAAPPPGAPPAASSAAPSPARQADSPEADSHVSDQLPPCFRHD